MTSEPFAAGSPQPLTFTATVRPAIQRDPPGAVILDLAGTLDGRAAAMLNGAWAQALQAGAARVIFNFARVEHINSTGIALVVGLVAQARREGTALAAFGLGDHYAEIFRITRLSEFVRLWDDEQQALAGG